MIKYIALDIDRTLVHAVPTSIIKEEWKLKYETLEYDEYTVFIRPYLYTFLDYLFSTSYEIGLYTAGSREYAEFIRDKLFLYRGYTLSFIFSSDMCINRDNTLQLTKSLSHISKRLHTEPTSILLVDDSSAIKRYITLETGGDHCYLVSKFVVCFDDSNVFVPQMVENDGLLKCMDYIKKLGF